MGNGQVITHAADMDTPCLHCEAGKTCILYQKRQPGRRATTWNSPKIAVEFPEDIEEASFYMSNPANNGRDRYPGDLKEARDDLE